MIVTRPITSNFGNLGHKPLVQHRLETLTLGQRIDAVVLADSSRGYVTLRIGNSVIQASTSVALQQNAHLLLEVVQKHPHLMLRLLPAGETSSLQGPLRDALVNLLPKQVGLAPSIAGLMQKALQEPRSPELKELRSAIRSLVDAIPGRGNLSRAEGVRQAMLYSGLFLEAMLAKAIGKAVPDTSRDIKANLLRTTQALMQYLKNRGIDPGTISKPLPYLYEAATPPRRKSLPTPQRRVRPSLNAGAIDADNMVAELITGSRGAIARLGLHQIVTAENFNDGQHMWQLELPVKHSDAVEMVAMTIEKEQQRITSDAPDTWTVHLALDLPRLGPVQIRISQFAQGVSTRFWTDTDASRSIIEGHLDTLKAKLQRQGVASLNLSCVRGKPEQSASTGADSPNIQLRV